MGGPLAGWTRSTAYSTPFASNGITMVRKQRPRRLTIHVRHQVRVQEFVRGGGGKIGKPLFAFQFLRGGGPSSENS